LRAVHISSVQLLGDLEIYAMKRFVIGFMALVTFSMVGQAESHGALVNLNISYSGSNLGVSGTGVLQGNAIGNGEYQIVSGYIDAVLPGLGTVHETLVPNSNYPATSVFSNSNGDNFTYDDRVFVPYNAPASTDGAQLTYAGGLVFQTASPSKADVYLSAYNSGSFGGYFYFAGYDRPYGLLGDGSLGTLSITLAPVPEPSSIISASIACLGAGAFALVRKRKLAAV
jgi:hypothetical protein